VRLLLSSLLIAALVVLPSCGVLPKPTLVVPNTQLGAVNSQTVGKTEVRPLIRPEAGRDIVQTDDDQQVKAEHVETVEINQTSWWIILLLVLGWVLPTPSQIAAGIRSGVSKLWRKAAGPAWGWPS
jgi:hypothetical protein